MPGVSQIIFVARYLNPALVAGVSVIDVGAKDFNGSVKPLITHWGPRSYIGVDIESGACVDQVVSAVDLESTFGKEQFDIVLCVEMLEHASDWKRAVNNMKQITNRGGLLLLTTRSEGYPVHGFPNDFWRFSKEDMEAVFSDFELLALEIDPISPGIFVLARKPLDWQEKDLAPLEIFNVLTGLRERSVPVDLHRSKYYRKVKLKNLCRDFSSRCFLRAGRVISTVLGI